MTPLEAVEAARNAGVTLALDPAARLIAAPSSRLTGRLRAALSANKDRLRAALRLRKVHRAMGLSEDDVLFVERAILAGRVSELRIVCRPPDAVE